MYVIGKAVNVHHLHFVEYEKANRYEFAKIQIPVADACQ